MTSVSKRYSQSGGCKADEKVWYEDGNLMLLANGTGFRLYKGILASVSPVFREMFSLAKPEDEIHLKGCPVTLVAVTDSSTDLRHFLVTITTGFIELLDGNTLLPFEQLAATIRIAHKYGAKRIQDAAVSRLQRFFTPTIIQQLHMQVAKKKTWESLWDRKQRKYGVCVPLNSTTGAEVVRLARLLDCDAMLPLALLLCSALSDPLQLRNGVRRRDARLVKLSDGDYLKCVRTVPALTERLHGLGVWVMRQCARATPDGRKCGCKRVLERMSRAYEAEAFSGPLMDGFVWFQWRDEPPKAYASRADALCGECSSRLMKEFYEAFSELLLVVDEDARCVQVADNSNEW